MAASSKPRRQKRVRHTSPYRPPAFHVMLKPRGAICNLDCAYCFYLIKEDLYPDGAFRLSDHLLEDYTRQYIDAQRVPEVTFAWQGGEPTLMGLDFFRKAVEYQQRYAKPGMRINNSFQTNGILLNDDWAQFFHDNGFLIGLSIDGPQDIHDTYRVDKGQQPTWARVMDGLETLKKHKVDFNTLTCVHAANADRGLDVYRFLRDEAGSLFMQFIPIVERTQHASVGEHQRVLLSGEHIGSPLTEGVTERSVTGAGYGRFLISVFDEWVRRDVGRIFVQMFDVALAAWSGHRPGLCVFEETCGAALAMEHNGDVYACDHFVEPNYFLGNMQDTNLIDLVSSEQQHAFGQAKRDTLPRQCIGCDVRFVCNGGCPKDRLLTTQDGEPGLNYLCDGFYAFFKHIDLPMRIMANELRAQRPPANVMYMIAREEAVREQHAQHQAQRLAAQFATASRNDPCPCGSGKKFKHCHGRRG